MAVDNIWFWVVDSFYENDDSDSLATWSLEVGIPAHTVYASAALSMRAGSGLCYCGVLFYGVEEGGVRVPPWDNFGTAPAIFDNNVVTVVFGYGVHDAEASCHFSIFGFGH